MRLEQRSNTLTTNAVESGQFTIETNAKAFTLLVGNLYANKAESITREIWSNAYDSHMDAGKGHIPFEVTFPTIWESTFRCRDFGVGLSHEDVMGLYTTVFKSTKEDSNVGVGKWGLGSKSPFAYTDTFTVTSWYRGEVRYYTAAIGEDGVPRINLMGRQPSTDPDGLEVAFPVKSGDVELFKKAALRVSMGFDVKPKVTNGDRFGGWPEFTVTAKGNGYRILKEDYGSPFRGTIWAKMGCVIYPIKLGSIGGDWSDLSSLTAILDFNIGDLDVTGSREDLSYDNKTSKALTDRLEELKNTLVKDAIDKYNQATGEFEKAKAYYEIRSGLNYKLQRLFDSQCKGTSLIDITDNGLRMVSIGAYRIVQSANPKFDTTYSITGDDKISYSPKTTIYVEDTRKGQRDVRAARRLGEHLDRNVTENVIWIRLESEDCDDNLKKLLKKLKYPVVYIKDIPDPGPDKRDSKPVSLKYYGAYNNLYELSMTAEEIEDGGVFIPIANNYPSLLDDEKHPRFYNFSPYSAWGHLEVLDLIDNNTKKVAVPKTHWKRFINNDWETVWSKYSSMVEKHRTKLEAVAKQVDQSNKRKEVLDVTGRSKILIDYQREPDYVMINKQKVGPNFAREILAQAGTPAQRPEDNKLKEVYKDYPMLAGHGYTKEQAQEYVNLVDKMKGH